jgi:acetyl-CoA C-acetyltransferase
VDALLERNEQLYPSLIEEVYCGVGLPHGLQGFNMGRIVALLSERLPLETNGATISRYCASSLEAIRQASNAITAGQGHAYIAAGVEWVSRYNGPSRARARRTRTSSSRAATAIRTPTSPWA